MLPLLSLRCYLYRQYKWHYFLLDFCYFVNGLGFLVVLRHASQAPSHSTCVCHALRHADRSPLSRSPAAWQTLFISSSGPVLLAIVAWRNSLVFHSLDKVTSVYIHLFPALLAWSRQPCTTDY